MEKKEDILPLFDFTVPLNDKMLLKASKKSGKVAGILSMLASAIFAGLAVFSATAKNSSIWVVVLFGAFFVLSVAFGVYSFTKGKNNPKDNDLAYKYKFYEECLCVFGTLYVLYFILLTRKLFQGDINRTNTNIQEKFRII